MLLHSFVRVTFLPFLSRCPHPPVPPLFPYTTLFRSRGPRADAAHPAPPPLHGRRLQLPASGPLRRARLSPPAHLRARPPRRGLRSEEHTSELQSLRHLVCRLLLEKKKKNKNLKQSRQ